jgi:type IV pilus assembly protein PilF
MKIISKQKFLIFVIIITQLACATQNRIKDSADSHYKLGISYLEANEDAAAMREFSKALSINSKDARIYYAIASFYLKKHQINLAKENIDKALKIDPNNSEYLNTYASILASEGNLKDAIKVWEKVEKDPTYPSIGVVYYNMGNAYLQLDLVDKAIEYMTKSINESPNVVRPYLSLFQIFLKLNKPEMAEDVLKRGINRNPQSPILKMELAMYYYNKGLLENAANLFNDIIDISPNSEEAFKAKAYLKNMGLYYE